MDLWERLDLINEVNKCFYTEQDKGNFLLYDFRYNFSYTFWSYFYLIKVNVSLFFNWESEEEVEDCCDWICGLAYLNEEEAYGYLPPNCWDWEEVCTPTGLTNWCFGICSSSNY